MGCGGASRRPALMGRCPVCGRVPCVALAGSVVLADFSFWRGHWDINLWGFKTFLIIFNLFGNSLVNVVYTIFISNNRASFHLW